MEIDWGKGSSIHRQQDLARFQQQTGDQSEYPFLLCRAYHLRCIHHRFTSQALEIPTGQEYIVPGCQAFFSLITK